MPPKKDKLSKGLQNTWPEVFKDIKVDVIPIEYLTSIRVIFKDNKIWEKFNSQDLNLYTHRYSKENFENNLKNFIENSWDKFHKNKF